MSSIAAPDLADPVHQWIWMPVGSAGLLVWIVPVDDVEMLIAASLDYRNRGIATMHWWR